jgi:hypothetical protein
LIQADSGRGPFLAKRIFAYFKRNRVEQNS